MGDDRMGPSCLHQPPIRATSENPDVPLSAATRSLATEAATEIARFDAEVGSDIAPFSAILLRSESVASSRIENLTASAIALAELGDTSRENATVIVANTTAMQAAVALSDSLDGDAILAMHFALLGSTHPDRVPAAIADLEKFLSRHDLPPLIQAAIAHAQFETIHPFPTATDAPVARWCTACSGRRI